MNETHIIIAIEKDSFLVLVKELGCRDVAINENIIQGRKNITDTQEVLIFHGENHQNIIEHIEKNIIHTESIIILGSGEHGNNDDITAGDVVIPHTIMSSIGNSYFLAQKIGNNYDLEKFKLHLNGIAEKTNTEKPEDTSSIGDIILRGNAISYFLDEIQKKGITNNYSVVIHIGPNDIHNSIAIIQMMF